MAFNHVNTTTFTSAQPLVQISANARPLTPVTIYNGHSASIFIGDATIATSGATIGRTIPTASSQTFYAGPNDVIYGISAAGSTAGIIVITYPA